MLKRLSCKEDRPARAGISGRWRIFNQEQEVAWNLVGVLHYCYKLLLLLFAWKNLLLHLKIVVKVSNLYSVAILK